MDEIVKVFEVQQIEPRWSHVVVWSLNTIAILIVAWCIWEVLRALRAAGLAKRMEESTSSPYEGARFVAGKVELANGAETAIQVTILQEGTQTEHKGNWFHMWTETHRDVLAVPFYVRTAKGERVRVEPPLDVMLVDSLDQVESLAGTSRRRRAELTPNEHAVIEGRLERGVDPELQGTQATYRTVASTGWIMKPDKRRGMSVSTESLSRRHELRAKAFAKIAIWTIPLCIVAMSIPLPYYARLFLGRNVIAEYRGKETYYDTSGKGRRTAYGALVFYEDPDLSQHSYISLSEVNYRDYPRLPATKKGHIWLRYVPGRDWATRLGRGSSVHALGVISSAFLLGIAFFLMVQTKRHRRWYEGHVVDRGQGPLPNPTKSRFLADQMAEKKPKPLPPAHVEAIAPNFSESEKNDS